MAHGCEAAAAVPAAQRSPVVPEARGSNSILAQFRGRPHFCTTRSLLSAFCLPRGCEASDRVAGDAHATPSQREGRD